jgi:hypothetical protein
MYPGCQCIGKDVLMTMQAHLKMTGFEPAQHQLWAILENPKLVSPVLGKPLQPGRLTQNHAAGDEGPWREPMPRSEK